MYEKLYCSFCKIFKFDYKCGNELEDKIVEECYFEGLEVFKYYV